MDVRTILNICKLKATPCRTQILEMLVYAEHALAHADIEQQIDPSIDRVTVYRTLKTFLDRGLIHKVLDDEGLTKYAFCQECSKEIHNHEHVHFKCESCGQTQCLENIRIPEINLPSGFLSTQKNILIQGICNQCK